MFHIFQKYDSYLNCQEVEKYEFKVKRKETREKNTSNLLLLSNLKRKALDQDFH